LHLTGLTRIICHCEPRVLPPRLLVEDKSGGSGAWQSHLSFLRRQESILLILKSTIGNRKSAISERNTLISFDSSQLLFYHYFIENGRNVRPGEKGGLKCF
jgi:hypothetical protein